MSDFKQCPNGHYYEGDHCPYCPPQKPFKLIPFIDCVFDNVPVFHVKVCPNMHGYEANLSLCPFCGSEVVVAEGEKKVGGTCRIVDMKYEKNGVPVSCNVAEVDGRQLTGDLYMRIEIEIIDTIKFSYSVVQKETFGGGLLVNPQSHIVLKGDGFSDTYTGREFYKMCDVLFDQNEKK